ncbi:MAG: ectonucleotide pyrophosphatase/phosphodiesterase [Lysobacteraceae bacterium]
MPMNRLALAALLMLLLASCAPQATRTASPEVQPTPLLLVSIDSFRPDYLDRGLTPTLSQLAREGVRSTGMQSSFPTVTFPNHYTLVTGLYPDHHGIVENTMHDPAIPGVRFSMSNRATVGDERWWDEATPIWNSADRAGLRTATMFWPGSEAPIHGHHPDYWKPFDENTTSLQRTDQVLAWLDLPPSQRPRFITLYFDSVDRNGHDHGPDSSEVNTALAEVDAALAHLLAGLQRRGLHDRINIVIVSDHGMASVPADHHIVLDDLLPTDAFDAVTLGAVAELRAQPGDDAIIEKQLVGRHTHMQCWRKQNIPARLHYGSNPRIPPFVCLADSGWLITTRAKIAGKKPLHVGEHGYDNDDPLMRALFIAHGPAFRSGVVLPGFPNVDVYPLLAKLLGIRPEPNDGDIAPLLPALR